MYPVVESYLASEKSCAEFCQKNKIAPHVMNYWLKRYREQDTKNKLPAFAPVEITDSFAKEVQIIFPNGMEIKIPIQ